MVDFAAAAARERDLKALGIRIYNKSKGNVPKEAVYVGRPTIYGNPFTHLPVKDTRAETQVHTREDAIKAYERWARLEARDKPEFRQAVKSLYKKDLVCWCWPLDCHALVLAKLAKEFYEEDIVEHVPLRA